MKLQEIFDDLLYSELSNHAIAIDGFININDRVKIINHINIGLNELYTRFPLKNKEVIIKQIANLTQYYLKEEHALTNTSTSIKYIIDSNFDPFIEDVIRIEGVYDECGDRYLANSNSVCKSFATPTYDCIEIPYPVAGNVLSVIYRAKHPLVTTQTIDIDLPLNFKPALLSYVAARVYAGGTATEHINKAVEFTQKFEMYCMQLEKEGMTNSFNELLNDKLEMRGWV